MENKLFYCLISISVFIILISIGTASEDSDKLEELYTLINYSENIPKIYYLEQVPELNTYWDIFYSNISYSKNIYEDFKDKESLTPEEITTINSLIYNLEENIDLIEILIDLEKGFTNRQASKNSNKGFEITINDQSITTNGANRLRAEYNREKSTVYLLMSRHLQGQSFWSGTSGLGLKTALMNVMSSDYCFQIKSSGEVIDLYYQNGTHKTNSRIESDAQDLALAWAEDNPFSKYSKLLGEPKTFTIVIRTPKGNLYERNYIFNFIDSTFQNFEAEYSYCLIGDKTVKCNEVQYLDSNNNLINLEKVKFGESAKSSIIPEEIEGHTFREWNSSLQNIVNDIITIPLYEKHKLKVIFKDNKNKIIEEQYVFYNEDAIPPISPESKGYKFVGWDKNIKNIKNNLTLYPLYEEESYFYNISNDLSENITILVGEGVYFPKINVSSLINNTTGQGTIPKITINVSNDYNMIIEIPLTNVTSSNLSWDGVIRASTLADVSIPKLEGRVRTQSLAIDIGFSEGNLFFSNAVRLIFPNESGKLVAYYSNEKFKEINTVCALNSQSWADSNLSEGKECYINSGSDLIVWTKHFTEFVTYTEVDDIQTQPVSKSAGGNKAPSSSPSNNCDASWHCTQWSNCIDGFKTRTCTYDKSKCYPTHLKPEEKLSCFENKEENKINLTSNKANHNKINTGFILGAVMKDMNYFHYILLTNVFLIVIVSTLITLKIVKKKPVKRITPHQEVDDVSR